ncbi:hypothetical protein HPB52_000935 [Rhipicephalus sanguineus]|uniref:Uncharacterized protein n=1 Tax=Rhipicephalus sanguineus TaxID=34632 RepID=A0A9D4PN86_RHISA|nr:hypothetical protein HPB52_000935 [Rhipicephalus sanguineus]
MSPPLTIHTRGPGRGEVDLNGLAGKAAPGIPDGVALRCWVQRPGWEPEAPWLRLQACLSKLNSSSGESRTPRQASPWDSAIVPRDAPSWSHQASAFLSSFIAVLFTSTAIEAGSCLRGWCHKAVHNGLIADLQ